MGAVKGNERKQRGGFDLIYAGMNPHLLFW